MSDRAVAAFVVLLAAALTFKVAVELALLFVR